ncbi:hypothetical protein FH972_024599 [Carpinus fangiana]|uniref:RBR-type E3 ubiquitin transferase n=1 Tax=Carpinus fangiana TaxID=176857 RepID=A0A5N6KYG3_9ROSI|nr:hypothetical protein FH972_024599 [Carpinus fangiana]
MASFQPNLRSSFPNGETTRDGSPPIVPAPKANVACPICYERKKKSEVPSHILTDKCRRHNPVCNECFDYSLMIAIGEKPTTHPYLSDFPSTYSTRAVCPACWSLLTPGEVKAAASPAVFEKWSRVQDRRDKEADSDFRWCLSTACSSGQKVDQTGRKRLWTCDTCGSKNCISCERPWHKGESCKDYQARIAVSHKAELQAEESHGNLFRLCPRPECRRKVIKTDGCSTVFCPMCSILYCWDCMAIDDSAYSHVMNHKPDCAHYQPPRKGQQPWFRHINRQEPGA